MSESIKSQKDTDTNLFTGLDIRAFWETLRLRWWIIPTILAISVGFLWAQESDLQTEPSSYFVSKTYEARDPTGLLVSVGIDPLAVRAFPDSTNQLLLLQSPATRDAIASTTGVTTRVQVTRNPPSFSLVDTRESNGQGSLVFQASGSVSYTFTCSESVRSTCDLAIDAYVEKAAEIRLRAITAGLLDLKDMLQTSAAKSETDQPKLQIAAIDTVLERLDTSFIEISTYVDVSGVTITSVRAPTYTFAVGAGLVLSLVILLQLTYSDRRIRSARRIVRHIGPGGFLGAILTKPDALRDRSTAIALRRAQVQCDATRVVFVPLRKNPSNLEPLQRLGDLCEVESTFTRPLSELSVKELTTPRRDEIDVLVAVRNSDILKDLLDAVLAYRQSGRQFAGVVLLD